MRMFSHSLFILLATAAIGSTKPLGKDSVLPVPRDANGVCLNADTTVAGDFLHPRSLTSRSTSVDIPESGNALFRRSTKIWCAPGSMTWIQITHSSPAASTPAIQGAVNDTYQQIAHTLSGTLGTTTYAYLIIPNGKDGPAVLAGESCFQTVYGSDRHEAAVLSVTNAKKNQITWGALGAAMLAFLECMSNTQYAQCNGPTSFNIYDGKNQVGQGKVTGNIDETTLSGCY